MGLISRYHHFNLRTKFSLVMIVLVVVIVVLILFIIYHQERNVILQQVEQRASDIAVVLAFNSVQATILDDYLVLQNLVDSISERDGVIEAMVLNDQGIVLVHNHTGERGKKYLDHNSKLAVASLSPLTSRFDYQQKRILDVAIPVMVASEKRATARIFFSLEKAYASVRNMAIKILIIGAISIIVSVLLSSIIAKIVTKPIQELSEAINKISRGYRDIQLEIRSHDETGKLAIVFNEMVKEILCLEENIRRSERLAAIGLAAASLAHKIKTPITSIRTFAEMLPGRYVNGKFRKTFQYHVLLQVNYLDHIMTELSNFSKERKFSLSRINVNEIISYICLILEKRVEKTYISITSEVQDVPLIWADKEQLTEAFLIIGENAIEAMSERGQLSIRTQSQMAQSGSSDENVKIIFTDSGKGIAADFQKKIFEPFYSTKTKGMGLGLAICANIIEKHYGSIQVQSEVNQGTIFEILLPVRSR